MFGINRVGERPVRASAFCERGFQTHTAKAAALAVAALFAISSRPTQAGYTGLQRVATGLSAPMFTTFAPGDPTRLFIAERGSPGNNSNSSAVIRVLDLSTPTPTLLPTPFLTIPNVDNRGEGGLLGLAFHPDYTNNGKFYVNVTAADSVSGTYYSNYIREYSVSGNPNVANTSFNPVLTFGQPDDNHNGGWIGFSPVDDYLYIMTGDGGNFDDQGSGHVEPGGNAQNTTANLLGKALRIDVNGDDFASATQNYRIPDSNPFADVRDDDRVVTEVVPGLDEIWSYGLRNPFRAGFDRATGDLWIGDVGQDEREEIDFQPGSSDGGENYGWRIREGLIQTPAYPIGSNPVPPGVVDPVYDYPHDEGDVNFRGVTVVGGVPYRGPDPTLQGRYFFADTYGNKIWTLTPADSANPFQVSYVSPQLPFSPVGSSPNQPASISEDANGNLYVTYLSGSVYRIVTNAFTPGDFNGDAKVDEDDLVVWKSGVGTATGATRATGDADGDGDVDGNDFLVWQRNLGWSALNVGSPTTPVPEPASAALIAASALVLVVRRRRAIA